MAKDYDLQPLLDVRQNQLTIIFGESNSIDTKALALIATNVAILIFIAQVSLSITHWWVNVVLVGSYIASTSLGIYASWPFPYKGPGINLGEHPEYLELDSQSLLLQLISDTEQAIERDKQLNHRRWRAVLASFVCMAIGTLVLFGIL